VIFFCAHGLQIVENMGGLVILCAMFVENFGVYFPEHLKDPALYNANCLGWMFCKWKVYQ
jgi:hypothetical protein